MFSLAQPGRRAIFFTMLGEPPLKKLRSQQQTDFFDFDKPENSIRFANRAATVADGILRLSHDHSGIRRTCQCGAAAAQHAYGKACTSYEKKLLPHVRNSAITAMV